MDLSGSEKPRLLVTGAGGFLGWHVTRAAEKSLTDWDIFAGLHSNGATFNRATTVKLDLCDPESLTKTIRSLSPSMVIHA
ncbi:MAG: NAD-dependent epimerase/dehydratase family protein, partial [bacterium]